MAGQELTEAMIAELARNVAGSKMESIALLYLGADADRVEALRGKYRGDAEPFNRDILRDWRNSKAGDNPVKELAALLHKAAAKAAYINPNKVTDILGVSKQQAEQAWATGTGNAPASGSATGSGDRSSRSFIAKASVASKTGTSTELTDAMVNNLAQCLTSEEKLRNFAVNGLGMRRYVVERNVTNHRRINDAGYHVLSEWLNTKISRVVAYRDLCDALDAAELSALKQELK